MTMTTVGAINNQIAKTILNSREPKITSNDLTISQANSAEELAISVKGQDFLSKKRNQVKFGIRSLREKVSSIDKVNQLIDLMDSKNNPKNMVDKFLQQDQSIVKLASEYTQEGNEPALIFLNLKKAYKKSRDPRQRDLIDDVSQRYLEDNYTAIQSSINVAKKSRDQLSTPEIASEFRGIFCKSNQEGASVISILSGLLTCSFDSHGEIVKAYSSLLAADLSSQFPSTDKGYLYDTYSQLSRLGSVKSLIDQADIVLQTLAKKYDPIEKTSINFTASILELTRDSNSKSIDIMASEYMGFGRSRKLDFVNCLYDYTKQMPMDVWDNDKQRNTALSNFISFMTLHQENKEYIKEL